MMNQAFKTSAGAAVLAFAIALTPGAAQGPMYDRIHVDLPYKVSIGDKVLQPGDYTIQQLSSQGNSRVLLFYTNNGMKFETSAMTIPTLDQNTPQDTKVILGKIGDDYYINKIWVQGKDYGYELPIPNSLKEREKEASQTAIAGRYEPASSTTASTTTSSATTTSTNNTATNSTNTNTTPNTTATEPSTTATTTSPTTSTVSPNTSPASPTDRNATANDANSFGSHSATSNSGTMAQSTAPSTPATGSANRSMDTASSADQNSAPTKMPHTAANWLFMLLSGGALSGAGMMLRRRQ